MKMGEVVDSSLANCQLHSFNRFVKNQSSRRKISSRDSSSGNFFDNETDGKKYKLRLKFDGACALEVIRLNGGHFQNLTHLDISGNSAEKLDLRSLARLEWLCCSNNNLEVLSLSGVSLTYLDCSHNNLQSISIDPVPNNLTTLQVSFNNLEDLPPWTWMVPELFIIYASHNHLRHLDCKFQNCLSNLPIRELHLHCNKIEFVSKDFMQRASRLKILNLSQNVIEHMPNFGKKCSVQELYLSRNRLQDVEDKEALDFLLECTQLRRLHLAFNKIEQINERCISGWKHLEELILCGNRIRILPNKICSLNNLRVLRVHANRLESAPNLSKMTSLKVVDLSHNNLRKINLENMISGGNLTYLDISCNERLTLNPEKLSSPKRPMNLVEVSTPSRKIYTTGLKNHDNRDFYSGPPWEIGFSELPDRNQLLSVTQYRDVNLSNGNEALFGIFDGGDGNQASKTISKSIAKIFAEERNIEETHEFSLKYTLLNAMKAIRQQGNVKPMQGILGLLSTHEGQLEPSKSSYMLNVAMIGGVRCLLIESGRKITRLTDMEDSGDMCHIDEDKDSSCDNESEISSSTKSASTTSNGVANNLSNNIPDPHVLSIPLSASAEYLVIANQGVWNHVSEAELMDELDIHRHKKSVLIAKRITDMAQSHSCKQSLSLIIIRFKFNNSGRSSGLSSMDTKCKLLPMTEFGPLSYQSSSSDYSDISNPLVSVTTPDSAIDTDRSSSAGGSFVGCKRSGKVMPPGQLIRRRSSETINCGDLVRGERPGRNECKKHYDEDEESIANTSISAMSVEQFRCWEYMLEQNTKLLFKKELDSLSKSVFQRNQKHRKSVHFPYQDITANNIVNASSTRGNKAFQQAVAVPNIESLTPESSPGFYTLSKAKSLSHLFSGSDGARSPDMSCQHPALAIAQSHQNVNGFANGFGKHSKYHVQNSNNGSGIFLGNIKPNSNKIMQSGPNSAYFGSVAKRLLSSSKGPSTATFFGDPAEIQEIKNYDSIEHDSRLKKYWDNKITEL